GPPPHRPGRVPPRRLPPFGRFAMSVRRSRRSPLPLVSISLAALATLVAGCAVPTGAPAEATGEASQALSYWPMGFARINANGGVTSAFDSATATMGGVTVAHTAGTGLYVVSFPALASGRAGNAQVT